MKLQIYMVRSRKQLTCPLENFVNSNILEYVEVLNFTQLNLIIQVPLKRLKEELQELCQDI